MSRISESEALINKTNLELQQRMYNDKMMAHTFQYQQANMLLDDGMMWNEYDRQNGSNEI